MYRDLSVEITHPTALNNKIIACYESVNDKILEYANDGATNIVFSQNDCLNTNGLNDFQYMISLLTSIYYDMKMTTNLGEAIDKEEIWEDNYLEDYIQYFLKYHNTDIEPMYEIFGLGSYPYGDSLFGVSTILLDVDPLFPL